jgi:hypothetical protein
MRRNAALFALMISLVVCWPASAEPRKITQDEKKFCAEAYHKYCGEYGLESAALRNCMDRNGRSLPHNCIEALIELALGDWSGPHHRRVCRLVAHPPVGYSRSTAAT